jgi:hypothetical protein
MLDAVTTLDMSKLTASEAQFVPTMAANLSERLEGIDARVTATSAGMEVPPEEDFEALRKVMGCVYEVRNKHEGVEYELDALQEIAGYLVSLDDPPAAASSAIGKVGALQDACAQRDSNPQPPAPARPAC